MFWQPPWTVKGLSGWPSQYISPGLRSRLFSLGAANEAVRVENLSRDDGPLAARWVTSQYESRKRTNSIFIGAANGAVTDLAAGLGAPYFPQTLLSLVRRQVDPDDIDAVITHGRQMSDKLAARGAPIWAKPKSSSVPPKKPM
mgnify:CR=1 FL=1